MMNSKSGKNLTIKLDVGIIIAFVICFLCIRCGNDGYLLFALIALWLFVAFIQDASTFLHEFNNKKYLPLYIFLLLIALQCSVFGGLTTGIGNTFRYIALFCGAMMFDYYKNKPNSLRKLTFLSVCFWTYYMVKALVFYIQNPGAARLIISHQGLQYGNIALGGVYGLSFGSALLFVLFISLLAPRKNSLIKKILLIIGACICFAICVYTESALTLFSAVFAMTIALLYTNKQSPRKKALISIIVFSLLVLLLIYQGDIGRLMMNWSPTGSRDINERIHEIGSVIAYSDYSGIALSGRIEIYATSIHTILTKPILGSIFYNGYPTSVGISGHSEILDAYALYGLITGVALTAWYIYNIGSRYKQMGIKVNKGCQVLAWLLILLNPFTYNSGSWALFFMMPAICLLNSGYDNRCKESTIQRSDL